VASQYETLQLLLRLFRKTNRVRQSILGSSNDSRWLERFHEITKASIHIKTVVDLGIGLGLVLVL
jgi:hypothetical protein